MGGPPQIFQVGQTFNSWTIIARTPGDRKVTCRCSCGKIKRVFLFSIVSGKSKRCGSCSVHLKKMKHGEHTRDKTSPEYVSWRGMINRCTNKNVCGFHLYGGRGIKVCDQWRYSFARFLADVGRRPTLSHSLDRINVDGNYEPGNVRWATPMEQTHNRRRTTA
jgi:hypothetical protein